jgi:hypothetical protein
MEVKMTIIEAINGIDALKPNQYTQEQKIEWLSKIDGLIKEQVVDTHEGGVDIESIDYSIVPINTKLLIPAPYDEIYLHYLTMKIDYAMGEYQKYNNSAQVYNTALQEYKRWYNREHMPKSVAKLIV